MASKIPSESLKLVFVDYKKYNKQVQRRLFNEIPPIYQSPT
jgi:hypothetical protein